MGLQNAHFKISAHFINMKYKSKRTWMMTFIQKWFYSKVRIKNDPTLFLPWVRHIPMPSLWVTEGVAGGKDKQLFMLIPADADALSVRILQDGKSSSTSVKWAETRKGASSRKMVRLCVLHSWAKEPPLWNSRFALRSPPSWVNCPHSTSVSGAQCQLTVEEAHIKTISERIWGFCISEFGSTYLL